MMQPAEVWAPIASAEVSIAIAEAFIGAVALASSLWDFSFFSDKRRKHYRILNQSVFKPLTLLQLDNTGSGELILVLPESTLVHLNIWMLTILN